MPPEAPAAPLGPGEPSAALPPIAPPLPRSRPPAASRPSHAETAGDGEGEARGLEGNTGGNSWRRHGEEGGRCRQVCGFVGVMVIYKEAGAAGTL